MNEKEFASETIEITTKTALSLIPVGGPLITMIWDSAKAHTLSKREESWKQAVEERLNKLECTVDELGKNESFTSALLIASGIAAKTAEEEKKKYLANAVANSAGIDINENKMVIFLSLMDKYTIWHIRLLDYFRDPVAKGAGSSSILVGSPILPIQSLFPDISAEKGIVEKLIKDMQNDGLIQSGDFLHVSMTSEGMVAARTTQLGNEFLDFILK